ncbi:MAG: hypothetical protein ABJB03_09100, partial [Rhodoglobus sp.]
MGVFDDFGRLINAGAKTPRPKFADSIKQAADAAEGAQAYKDAATMAAQAGTGGYGANPFENLAMMNSAIAGSGVV